MADAIRRVVVVGGGTAGWLVAGHLAARFPKRGPDGIEITLVEAPGRPPIGVGEGTWPSLRTTLKQMGVSETELLRACDAAFKQGSRFVGWRDGSGSDAYLHPFTLPAASEQDLAAIAAAAAGREDGFAREVCFQPAICEAGRAPKAITMAEYAGAANYAYHLDAGKFGELLRRHCTGALAVRHELAEIVRIEADEGGLIAALHTAEGGRIEGDLFIDCSGFAALLIGGHYGVPFRSLKSVLFVDRAWAVQAPYGAPDTPIPCVTTATAQAAGWIWDIGLTERRGLGHVYASAFSSDDDALAELHAYLRALGHDPQTLSFRRIEINPGRREVFWRGNCVAAGLSAGFIEPLEASAIALVELSAKAIGDLFPRRRADLDSAARAFNEMFDRRWDRVIEFLKLHYVLSARADTPFWIENRRAESFPDGLAERLETWRRRPPGVADFPQVEEIFPAASYQYVQYGMGVAPEPAPWLEDPAREAAARRRLAECAELAARLVRTLPPHRDLLERVAEYGLQKI